MLFETKRSQSGLSLLEGLVTLSILSVATMVAVPSISATLDKSKIRYAAESIADQIEDARFRSIETGKTTHIVFGTSFDGVKIDTSYEAIDVPPGTSVDVTSTLTLFPSGRTNGTAVTLTRGRFSSHIHVDQHTGVIEITHAARPDPR